jgi:hypothetical protein
MATTDLELAGPRLEKYSHPKSHPISACGLDFGKPVTADMPTHRQYGVARTRE